MVRKNIWLLIISVSTFFLMGMSMEERRAFNDRIQEELRRSYEVNRKPNPAGGPRAMRHARNRYRNCCTNPIYPKTIYREPVHVPPNQHQRFYGGLPR